MARSKGSSHQSSGPKSLSRSSGSDADLFQRLGSGVVALHKDSTHLLSVIKALMDDIVLLLSSLPNWNCLEPRHSPEASSFDSIQGEDKVLVLDKEIN